MESPMAVLRELSVQVSGKVLLEIDEMIIGRRESLVILGPNGSGKTTLVKVLNGERRPWTGRDGMRCILFGMDRWNLFQLRHRMGLVSMDMQKDFHGDIKAINVILSGYFESMDVYRNHSVEDWMMKRCLELTDFLGISELVERDFGTLSLGEARRFLIARALVNSPETLVLDEPMTGLDIVARGRFIEMMEDLITKGIAIILITHDLEDIPDGMDRVIMMKGGEVFLDGPKEELLDSANLTNLFGADISVDWARGRPAMRLG